LNSKAAGIRGIRFGRLKFLNAVVDGATVKRAEQRLQTTANERRRWRMRADEIVGHWLILADVGGRWRTLTDVNGHLRTLQRWRTAAAAIDCTEQARSMRAIAEDDEQRRTRDGQWQTTADCG
jgi:hypothetical protein